MYSSGDANGMRAWSPYTLGPGSDTNDYSYILHLGDIKVEGNIEYRFDLFWKLEGALFLDAGNVWMIKDPMERPGTEFKWNRFLDDIAIGAGIGIRFDLSFLLLRTDFGYKLRDPRITKGSRWIDANKTGTSLPGFGKRLNFQFAIGYPF
jgi:outer membrane protein assembly factor BamA